MMIDTMVEQAKDLSDEDRTELVVRLLDMFEDSAPVDPEHEAAWTEVIKRRLQEAREGRVQLVESSEVMAKARATLAARYR
jgi:hypothetical protein